MYALAGRNGFCFNSVIHVLHGIAENTGSIDNCLTVHFVFFSAELVFYLYAGDLIICFKKSFHAAVIDEATAMGSGSLRHINGQPRVIKLSVVVQYATA